MRLFSPFLRLINRKLGRQSVDRCHTARMLVGTVCGIAVMLLMAGCEGYGPIDQQVAMEKAYWRPIKLVNHHSRNAGLIGASRISNHGLLPEVGASNRPGRYFFSIPADVTTVQKTTPAESEYLLYAGALRNQLRPFLTIILARQPLWMYKNNPTFRVVKKKSYVLNNLSATQVSGYYHDKPFTELVLTRFTSGSVIDALAIVRSQREREMALKILDTMRWIPAAHH